MVLWGRRKRYHADHKRDIEQHEIELRRVEDIRDRVAPALTSRMKRNHFGDSVNAVLDLAIEAATAKGGARSA